MEDERAGGPLKIFVDLFLVLLILAAFAFSVIFLIRHLNASNNVALSESPAAER